MKTLLLLLMVFLYRDVQLNDTDPYTYNEKEVTISLYTPKGN